jgi:hypothetical protein
MVGLVRFETSPVMGFVGALSWTWPLLARRLWFPNPDHIRDDY